MHVKEGPSSASVLLVSPTQLLSLRQVRRIGSNPIIALIIYVDLYQTRTDPCAGRR